MNQFRTALTLLIALAVMGTAGCKQSDEPNKDTPEAPQASGNSENAPDQLDGIVYPKAVIRFKVGETKSQQLSEGLHFVAAKREKGHLTHDVDGKEHVLTWHFLGSDDQGDKYRIALQLPDEDEPGFNKEISYSGEPSMVVLRTNEVTIKIEESMDDSDD